MEEIFTYEEVPAKGFGQKFCYAVNSMQGNFSILKEGKVVYRLTAWDRSHVRHTVDILNGVCGKCTR